MSIGRLSKIKGIKLFRRGGGGGGGDNDEDYQAIIHT